MTKHTLFVCKSCHCSEELSEDQLRDGTRLLEQIQALSEDNIASSELEIQPVGCLWACHHGCVAAIASPEKPTFLFTKLPPDDSAQSLLEFAQHYIQRDKGTVPWKKIPEQLKSLIARIPSVLAPYSEEDEE
ncbi:MAG: DUF1636 family protein [Leptolyngbya sp. Prado105]|jgi:predicted metal-binding protein|nr:DUF1636 family protein [Leptolyngbya sp. Prado105]